MWSHELLHAYFQTHSWVWIKKIISTCASYFIFIFYRLLTTTKEDATGGVFHLSAPDTVFGKVYQNNMDDDNSYKGQDTISSALKHPKTAFYYNRAKVLNRKEYKTCQVK